MYSRISNYSGIIRDADSAVIPPDPDNRDWQAYQGWLAEGNKATDPPAAPPPALPAITDRQFGEGLWREKLISFAEYLAFVGPGTVPPPLLAIINTLDDDDTGNPTPRKVALGLVTGAQTYAFDNSLVDVVRQAQGWSEDYLRERWAEWAQL
ncbi:hypothetical protein [Methylobacterium gnaphalii]|uniref:Uncharacterized protein n=1 Tax=Methylobacterium gnaphalii TaxID=1010610 RepID=A0A512JS86_9HYPH|nr:hypothetical protein [Methylobacterium gnaphalii]GEP12811.1 hypothetical protein MGN01_46560 [Methylobacterium gnaphalii]GJD70466.1 hypothetical protein MMMDOFMJ_3415 [Methylobacterium gnaphalii]GLS50746.1 hypothetical protein GCM10007885_36000 [Methylobacterium gnaphalii]